MQIRLAWAISSSRYGFFIQLICYAKRGGITFCHDFHSPYRELDRPVMAFHHHDIFQGTSIAPTIVASRWGGDVILIMTARTTATKTPIFVVSTVRSHFNSLAPGKCGSDFWKINFKLVTQNGSLRTQCLRWIQENTFDDKSTLVEVMAWCHQAASHYLSQCWPKSMSS